MLLVSFKRYLLIGPVYRLVNAHTTVPLLVKFCNKLFIGSFLLANNGCKNDNISFRLLGNYLVCDCVGRLALDGDIMHRAVGCPNPRIQQPEIVIYFRNGAHGGTRIF